MMEYKKHKKLQFGALDSMCRKKWRNVYNSGISKKCFETKCVFKFTGTTQTSNRAFLYAFQYHTHFIFVSWTPNCTSFSLCRHVNTYVIRAKDYAINTYKSSCIFAKSMFPIKLKIKLYVM